jgi:hypothetical protein
MKPWAEALSPIKCDAASPGRGLREKSFNPDKTIQDMSGSEVRTGRLEAKNGGDESGKGKEVREK